MHIDLTRRRRVGHGDLEPGFKPWTKKGHASAETTDVALAKKADAPSLAERAP